MIMGGGERQREWERRRGSDILGAVRDGEGKSMGGWRNRDYPNAQPMEGKASGSVG